jgi:hypothetical protein
MELEECGFLDEQKVRMIGTSVRSHKNGGGPLGVQKYYGCHNEPCAKSTVVEM